MPPHPTRPLTAYELFHLRPSLLQNDVTSTPTGVTIGLKTINRCAFCFQILKLTYTIKTKTKKAQTGHIESHIFLNFVGMKMDIDQIKQTIYDIVVCIPEGCVTTYSDVARFAGMPNHARVVGKILRETPQDLAIPCHRVVGSGGRLASQPSDQRKLLEEEGVPFLKSGRVGMRNAYWDYNSLIRF